MPFYPTQWIGWLLYATTALPIYAVRANTRCECCWHTNILLMENDQDPFPAGTGDVKWSCDFWYIFLVSFPPPFLLYLAFSNVSPHPFNVYTQRIVVTNCFFPRLHWASESYNPPACLSALCFHHRPGLSGLRALCIIMPACDVCWMLNCFELNTRMLCCEWFISLQSA